MKKFFEKLKSDYFIGYIYLYIMLMPWNFAKGQMGLLTAVLFIWWLIIGKKRGYFSKLKDILNFKPLMIFILFIAFSYISLLWTTNMDSAFHTVLRFYKYYFFLVPVFFTVLTFQQAKNGLYLFVVSLGLYSLLCISLYLDLLYIRGSWHTNPRGILAYAIVSPYMAIGAFSGFFIAIYEKRIKLRVLFFIIAFLCLIGLFINNGRAGQLAFFVTVFIFLFVYRKSLFKNLKIIFLTLALVLISVYVFQDSGKFNRLSSSFKEFQNLEEKQFAGGWGHRAYMWYAAADIIKKEPILGVGAGDNIDEFVKYTEKHPSKATWLRTFHNQHLDTLTRFGIIGFVLLWGSVLLLLFFLRGEPLFLSSAVAFFSVTFFDGMGDIILLMKPYNNIFVMIFMLMSIIALKKEINMDKVI